MTTNNEHATINKKLDDILKITDLKRTKDVRI
jgi:hypothetical protein